MNAMHVLIHLYLIFRHVFKTMKPYQKPPMEAAVLPATEMVGRTAAMHSSEVLSRVTNQQRPPIPGTARGPPPHYKSRPPMYNPPAYPVPAPRTGSGISTNPGSGKLAKPTARYHPSLSGSETDVSTSTENLTQVRKCTTMTYQPTK